ncbi:hypothetical protein [Eubacterium coprostanoligenes]|uniref:Uncharacterized protein n=1 Tax=Eubacterium coprostanoligenes TaxID=290054 RepID=A0A1T4N6V5_9FIRM|nr:hypothetical protein [Eubacterium coprostanoligenes]SJZ74767.1 hypothetical protein SAMN02745114_01486 [Eubacterium coprostanoligenes]
MFEMIDSKYTRDRYEGIGFQLTDFQKATLIWNKPNITLQERLSALKNLAINTADSDLKVISKEQGFSTVCGTVIFHGAFLVFCLLYCLSIKNAKAAPF